MSDIVIEKNVEIPEARIRNNHPYKEMEIGDSFFVENGKLARVCNNNYRMQKLLGCKFIARSEQSGDVKGVRVWRTE
jgi:hypothetical protein